MTIAVLSWVAIAVVSRDIAPWFFWLTMLTLPACVIFFSEADYIRSPVGKKISGICILLFMAHVAWAFGRIYYYDAAQPDTYWLDDHNYFNESSAIADAWRKGQHPDIWLKGSPPYLGTLHTGYHRPLSTLFLLFGPATIWGLLLNAVCLSCIPMLAALAARYLWAPNCDGTPPVRKDYGFLAACFTALHPNQFYWASYLMKDAFVAFVFMTGLVLVLGAYQRKSPILALGGLFILPYMFTVRAYTALSLIAGASVLPFLKLGRKTVFSAAAIGGGLMAVFLSYTTTGNALYRQLRDSFVALAPPGLENPFHLLQQMGAGIPRLFLAPYAWLILPEPSPMYGLYPGMWYLYLIGYPLAFSGLYYAVRRNVSAAAVPLVVFGLSSLIFLSAIYQGNASRQRFYMEYTILIFAAYGVRNLSWWWVSGILLLEAAFAIGQLLSLR